MRAWLITSTSYGTWLPGDARGSVTSVRDRRPGDPRADVRIEHDTPGELYEEPIPALAASARDRMNGPPIFFELAHAETILAQFHETAGHRHWNLLAVAIMFNHFHLVVRVPGDPEPEKILGDFKAYASRTLSRRFGRPASETWWTSGGSKRKLPDRRAELNGINYVATRQPNPLVVRVAESEAVEVPSAPYEDRLAGR